MCAIAFKLNMHLSVWKNRFTDYADIFGTRYGLPSLLSGSKFADLPLKQQWVWRMMFLVIMNEVIHSNLNKNI